MAIPEGGVLLPNGPDEAYLLSRRLAALRLNPREVERSLPDIFATLHRSCIICDNQGRCAWQLGDDFADDASLEWQEFCSNAGTFNMLLALPGFVRD